MKQPKIRFNQFDEELKEEKLGLLVDIFRGASPRPKSDPKFYGGPVPRLMIEDVTRDGKYVTPKIDSLTLEGAKKSRLLEKGSLVLSCSGTRVAIPGILSIDACIHDGFFGFKNYKNLDKEFLFYFFEKLHESIQSSATKGATFNNLTTEIMKTMSFIVPSLEEQQKIASFFNLLDQKIKKQQEKIVELELFKKGIMQKIFSQELRFKDEDGGEFPEWEEQTLSHFTKRVVRKNKGIQSTRPLTISAQLGLVDQKEFFNKNVASANTEGYYLLKKGEFAYNKSYSNGYPWGAIKRLDKYEDGVLSTLYICFEPLDNIDSDFLSIYFESTFWYKEVSLISGEGARNHGLLNIGVNDFFETKHKLPSIKEQQKIASVLMQLNKKVEKEKEKLMVLEEQKKGFMQGMFV